MKFIYITIEVKYALYVSVICNFLKIISKNQIVYLHLYAYADDDTLL